MSRDASALSQMLACGFNNPRQSGQYLAHLEQWWNLQHPGGDQRESVLLWFENAADPDAAALALLRLVETHPQNAATIMSQGTLIRKIIKLFGASGALGDKIIADPTWLTDPQLQPLPPPRSVTGKDGWRATPEPATEWITWLGQRGVDSADRLRRAYWQAITLIAIDDLENPDRLSAVQTVSAAITDLVDATLHWALELAKTEVKQADKLEFSIISMGKTGGQELNYISDVDVIYLYEPIVGEDERESARVAGELATRVATICAGPGEVAPLWNLDAGLRPEGRNGDLVRTLEACRTYYQNWAQNWEFHALLKARPAAGSRTLGQAFLTLVEPLVWQAANGEGFVDGIQQMRQLVLTHLPSRREQRELKLGRGGLRDIEFTVQLLQLVHGRTDPSLRVRHTLTAIERLSEGGYIARSDATEFAWCYRFLRTLEHGAQLMRMRRTHLLPTAANELRRIGRAIDRHAYGQAQDLEQTWQRTRARVRQLHEDLFYRPIVAATARLSSDQVLMTSAEAEDRLRAIGYRDPAGALRHVSSLTRGTSRRATIQRNLLPVIISWLSAGADPDQGLLAFRQLSDAIGTSHWYLALLRDSALVGQRLCAILPNSILATQALSDHPQAVQWLEGTRHLTGVGKAALEREAWALVERHDWDEQAASRLRQLHWREVTRAALADTTLGVDVKRTAQILSEATDVLLNFCIRIAMTQLVPRESEFSYTMIAMGRYGGSELTYGSDADVLAVYWPGEMEAGPARDLATKITKRVTQLVGRMGTTPTVNLDFSLRPEGKNGALARTVEQYRDYWRRWAATWEKQALLRARPIDDSDIAREFINAADQVRYRVQLTPQMSKEIRLLKARMETERLPRGVKPSHHLKLGPGGMSDVEWVAQLCQMRHGADPRLHTTTTVDALKAAVAVGALDRGDADILLKAWLLAAQLRAANMLANARPRTMDLLPRQREQLRMVAKLLGWENNQAAQVVDSYLKAARHARRIYESFLSTLTEKK